MPLEIRIALLSALILCGCHRPAKKPTQSARPHAETFANSPATYDVLVRRGMEQLSISTQTQERTFQMSRAAWNVDQDGGVIQFQGPDNIVATAPVQIIGTYNMADGTWLWAWDNPSVSPNLSQHATGLREYGQQNGLAELTTATLTCDEEHCWTFVAAAAAMTNAQGAYRGVAGDTEVFMTFGEVELNRVK